MEDLNASDAKREFGHLLLKVQVEPVGVRKNGKLVAVVISPTDYQEFETLREEKLRAAIQDGLADVKAGRLVDGKTLIKQLHARLA